MAGREDDDRRRPRPVPGWGSWGQSADHSAAGPVGGTGGGKAFDDPGVGHAAGQSTGGAGGVGGVGGVGGDKGIGDFGGVKSFGDTGLGHAAGQPLGDVGDGKALGQNGFGSPGHSGMAHTGGGVSAKTVLVAGAATVAVGAAAVAALLALRPDAPRQNAQQESSVVGATPVPGGVPGSAGDGEAVVRGTYASTTTVTSSAGTSTNENVVTAASDCARCDVTFSGNGGSHTYHWVGEVLESVTDGPICAGDVITVTPTAVADGFVQELTVDYSTCNGVVTKSAMTRTGD